MTAARLFVVMGVAGCGKTTVGRALADALAAEFLEGDAFHPPGNIRKMSAGQPLTDDDRWPWLERFAIEMGAFDGLTVGGCSALRRAYRDHIRRVLDEPVVFIHLVGSRELIASRMAERTGHFMPASLLQSQFDTLEPPQADENAISVGIDDSTAQIVDDILLQLEQIGGDLRR